jgi:hypothetical protein
MTTHPIDDYPLSTAKQLLQPLHVEQENHLEAHSMTDGREFDKPAHYRIRVRGNLEVQWSDWFDGFSITPQANTETVLIGAVADQAALHGLLAKVRDLGLPLLEVKLLENYPQVIWRMNNG